MFKKVAKADKSSKKSLTKKMKKMSYDEHLTRTSESIDLMKSTKFVDIGDGISKHEENDYDKLSK